MSKYLPVIKFISDYELISTNTFDVKVMQSIDIIDALEIMVHGVNFYHQSLYYEYYGIHQGVLGKCLTKQCITTPTNSIHIFVINLIKSSITSKTLEKFWNNMKNIYLVMYNYRKYAVISETDKFNYSRITKLTLSNIRKKCQLPNSPDLANYFTLLINKINSVKLLSHL